MAKKTVKLSIPHPCSAEWNEMRQEEKGKFCANCQKTVVDFRNFSDEEIAEIFRNSPGKMCGRFYRHQLNREISTPGKNNTSLHKIAAGLIALALLEPVVSNAETRSNVPSEQLAVKQTPGTGTEKEIAGKDTLRRTIKGVVLDAVTRKPVPSASVYIQDSDVKTLTTKDGKFTLTVPGNFTGNTVQLVVQASNVIKTYETFSLSIDMQKLPLHKTILLQEEKYELMGDIMPE